MLSQLCMIGGENLIEFWLCGIRLHRILVIVIRSFGSYVIVHCLIFYWYWPISTFSDIAFMQLSSERDRFIMYIMHGPFDRLASPHADLVLQDANPRAFPFCPQWPCRMWDNFDIWTCTNFDPFVPHSNLYFGQILEFGCGRILHA